MTIEADLYNALKVLCARTFPDVAPVSTARPYVTYSQIGGDVITYLGRELPSKKNGTFQVNVWADSRASASALMLQIEAAIITATTFQAIPNSAMSSDYDNDMIVYGSMQDFSIWSDR